MIFVKHLLNPNLSSLLLFSSTMASSSKVIAEYAKSSRSSCKSCRASIPSGALRLGVSTRDPRGFDATRWHHVSCFPVGPDAFAAEAVKGFSSLKSCDQETLRKLEAVESKEELSAEEIPEDVKDLDKQKEANQRDLKARKVSEVEGFKLEETNAKKTKKFISFSCSDVKNTYKDVMLSPKWKAFQTVIFREKDDGYRDSEKIAAFDFDGCLAKTSVKRVGANAWSLLYPSIPEKLQDLYANDYKLVIFTNESNIERWKNKRQQAIDSKVGRLDHFIKRVDVPMQVFIACGLGKGKGESDDPFRKPNTGMWQIMKEHLNSGIPIDMDKSFYVGDAAGRVNDHSDADIKFAQAIGLKFYLPEEYFCG